MSRYYSNNSKTVQDRAILADQHKIVYDLSISAVFNDGELPYPRFQGHANIRRWMSHWLYKI